MEKLLHQQLVDDSWRGVRTQRKKLKYIDYFRSISILNAQGKLFFGDLASRLTRYLLMNEYIDTSMRKGGVPVIAGCLDHENMTWEIIQKAKKNKKDLNVIWLDLANAYGSVPRRMKLLSLPMYHIPKKISKC